MFAGATLIGFPPTKSINALDQWLAQLLWEPPPPKPEEVDKISPIIFVDIDNKAIEEYAQQLNETTSRFIGKSTPRDLLAALLKRVREAKPAVVVLDIDLRDPRSEPGDSKLREELGKRDTLPLVLIPRIISPTELTSCSKNNRKLEIPHAQVFHTVVEDTLDPVQVKFVHPYFELNWLGDVRGICPRLSITKPLASGNLALGNVSLQLPAMSEEAVILAQSNSAPSWLLDEKSKGTVRRVRFRVGGYLENYDQYSALNTRKEDRVLYKKLPASDVLAKEWLLPFMDKAIVIIGTSHDGSEEYHSTALGRMPGPVVHANAMLQLQIGQVAEMSTLIQWVIKFILCLGLAFIHAGVYVYNVERAAHNGHKGIACRLKYFSFAAILSLASTVIYYVKFVPLMAPDEVAVMGPFVVICAELLFEVVKGIDEFNDKWIRRAIGIRERFQTK